MKKRIIHIVLSLLMIASTCPVFADELTETQKMKNSVDTKLNSIIQQKQTTEKKQTEISKQKTTLTKAQQEEAKKFDELQSQVKTLSTQVAQLDNAVKESEEKYNEQMETLKNRLKAMYVYSSSTTYLETLIESKSVTDFLGRMQILALVARSDKQLVAAAEAAKQDMAFKKGIKEQEKAKMQDVAVGKQIEIQNISVSRSKLEGELKTLTKKLQTLEEQEDALIRQSEEIQRQIMNLQKKGTTYTGGSMVWPSISSRSITSSFGNRFHPILKTYKLHTGIDIGAANGTSILAANKGTVIYSGWQTGYGNTVIIDHGGGISTLYAHSSKIITWTGANVNAGDVIAKVGSTGWSTGAHLHFEVRKNGEPTNPLNYVSP